MKKLFKYLKPYLGFTIIAPLFMFVEVFMDLMQPTLMINIIDVGIAAGDQPYILKMSLIMVGCALLGVIGGVGNMIFSTKAGFGFAQNIRSALYERIQRFSFANVDKFNTGSLVTRVTNDVTQIQNAFTTCIRMLIRAPFLCIGGIVAILALNKRLSLVVLAAVPPIAVFVVILLKKGHKLFDNAQKRLDRENVVMQENLAGVRVIKAFGRAEYEKERFKVTNDQLADANMKAMRMMAVAFPVINLIMNATMIAMYWFGGKMVFNGNMTAGEIMAFSNYLTQILMSLTTSSFMLMFITRASVSFDRVNEVLDTEIDIDDGSADDVKITNGAVEFDNVTFSYPGQAGDPVLQNISFTAKPGETVAILGSTGSGKSTLISLIPRLYDASEGTVKIDGHDVREFKLDNLRGSIGVALQESILFSGSISDNLRWGDENAENDDLCKFANIAQASEFIEKTEDKYETYLGQRGVNLSGGQKQRLSIARALVKKPRILILDDSTSAVDLSTEAKIQKGLREAMGDMTVFIIAQRISAVMDADKIIVLDNGRIADIGKHTELKQRCQIYREIVESQLGKEAL